MKKLLVLALMFSSVVFAKEITLDKNGSKVGFEIIKFKIKSIVTGEFKEFEGKAAYDEKTTELSDVNVKIKAASINTQEEKRDGHLKSPDFFDVEKFPELTFISKEKVKAADSFKLKGDLTIHGVTKPVVLDVKKIPNKDMSLTFEGTTTVNKNDFGIVWNKPLEESEWNKIKGIFGKTVIGEEVTVKVHAKFNK